MPFTFSHPAIVLPMTYLPRKWFSMTGLIIGSMTPDFEYFMRMRIQSQYSHTILGLFWFDLPLGLILAYIFHHVIRDMLYEHVPLFFKSRFIAFTPFNWTNYFKDNWIVVASSILIGAASHILWDSFTHDHGYFVQTFTILKTSINILGSPIPILKLLQHTSTLFGGLVITYAIYKLPHDQSITRQTSSNYWIIVIGLTLVIVAIRFICGLELKQLGNTIVSIISAGLLSLTIAPSLIRKFKNN